MARGVTYELNADERKAIDANRKKWDAHGGALKDNQSTLKGMLSVYKQLGLVAGAGGVMSMAVSQLDKAAQHTDRVVQKLDAAKESMIALGLVSKTPEFFRQAAELGKRHGIEPDPSWAIVAQMKSKFGDPAKSLQAANEVMDLVNLGASTEAATEVIRFGAGFGLRPEQVSAMVAMTAKPSDVSPGAIAPLVPMMKSFGMTPEGAKGGFASAAYLAGLYKGEQLPTYLRAVGNATNIPSELTKITAKRIGTSEEEFLSRTLPDKLDAIATALDGDTSVARLYGLLGDETKSDALAVALQGRKFIREQYEQPIKIGFDNQEIERLHKTYSWIKDNFDRDVSSASIAMEQMLGPASERIAKRDMQERWIGARMQESGMGHMLDAEGKPTGPIRLGADAILNTWDYGNPLGYPSAPTLWGAVRRGSGKEAMVAGLARLAGVLGGIPLATAVQAFGGRDAVNWNQDAVAYVDNVVGADPNRVRAQEDWASNVGLVNQGLAKVWAAQPGVRAVAGATGFDIDAWASQPTAQELKQQTSLQRTQNELQQRTIDRIDQLNDRMRELGEEVKRNVEAFQGYRPPVAAPSGRGMVE